MNWLLVILGAMVGAPARYLVVRAVQARHDSAFPWGTFTVNIAASLILGLVTGAVLAGAASSRVGLLVGTGLCGALSTYSTFSYETLRLAENGSGLLAAANVAASMFGALGAAVLGMEVARAVWG
ncbi:fluoride efflux transporter FluC [Candidatus Frankia nodulisporulans]|uniref:fluoride efflux transporter FluC n=1 Tax=Candidatus Frankia nodulisporulans TaxID=2060052 RepID=UPI0013D44A92|nr:CrcB family protein [Candidatus Frankia nodulisporulans]